MPFKNPVRAVHAVVLRTGKVLMVAGSGNDPERFAAGSFETAVYDPADGSFTTVDTPIDLFCAGHVQLADGKVLIMGGNRAIPPPTARSATRATGTRTSSTRTPRRTPAPTT